MINNLTDLDAAIRQVNLSAPAGCLGVETVYEAGQSRSAMRFTYDGGAVYGVVDYFGGEYAETDGRELLNLIAERMIMQGWA
jgi:hypothetical protein